MQKKAIQAGFYESQFGNFPKLQILTIEELLDGKKLLYPYTGAVTCKRAERQSKRKTEQDGLNFQHPTTAKQTRLPGRDFSVALLLDDIAEGDADA